VHALAHALGGMFDTMHGLVHPVLLPHVLRFNLPSCIEKMSHIGEIFIGRVGTPYETALAGIEAIEEFFDIFNVNRRLREIVKDSPKLESLCKMAHNDACLLTNPREATWEDLLAICREAW
ncbi:MAG: iron-containing alcohol dehydrogenase, partial [Deltaproteobacteria bacterium]|nr:iron-containing alcohol dehydrogenase [Deltaproteobacteria bacterium]